ncbi:putative viral capsid protein [Condylorrhiza vestigialis mutiple nucleopolyhedrovirus]|uniref:Putative viral capsid protein n=1 Tax=Condylorrhiza vestigialis mutiple nucleopolyhedrovirus TaxID=1592576 RepID=A0A0B4UM33_9ABAC|nr:putative viral capsid protein [Condylorrhiza vestigialis mutiple nucleopolyhedrovirus]AJD09228.1 putative viral capsid protein [Condylorrhiza vestigialis mutiple nucleopolyhedrovirus]
MQTDSSNNAKLMFFKALDLQPSDPVKCVLYSIAEKCSAGLATVATIKRKLRCFDLTPDQFDEALRLSLIIIKNKNNYC